MGFVNLFVLGHGLVRWWAPVLIFASGFYLVVPGLSATCMFCLNVHSRDSSALCQSLFKVQGEVLPHPIHTMPRGILLCFSSSQA